MTMRLLYINTSTGWGGMEMHPLVVAEELSRRGNPLLFAVRRGTPSHRHASGRGFAPISLPFRWYFHPGTFFTLQRMVRAFGIDVVHVHASQDAWRALLLAAGVGKRAVFVMSRHLASPAGARKTDPMHRLLAKKVDAVVAVSAYIRENILAAYEIPEHKVHVIPYGLGNNVLGEQEPACAIRRNFHVPENGFLVGMVSQITPDKRQDLFLEAARRVLEFYPKCRFVMVGAPVQPSYEAEIHRRIAEWSLEGKVLLAGFRRDIPDVMKALDILVLPSRAEAFGLVLLEAMANARPIVASASGAVPEIVHTGENGLLFPPGDAGAMAEALISLLGSREEQKRMGRAGAGIFQETYTLAREAEETERLYRSLLEA
jgi:glycosyltransferase involved in cell wall biosynthesis